MMLAGLAGCLRPASKKELLFNGLGRYFGSLRVLRVTLKPQARKKPNKINACGLAGLVAPTGERCTRKVALPLVPLGWREAPNPKSNIGRTDKVSRPTDKQKDGSEVAELRSRNTSHAILQGRRLG